ncbi:MAG TPA: leucyl aminopeptidase [Patescibacteria group bacterium]|nr:leucyl aminopeptidase [Patescibacteria group bacterium]
MQVKRSSKISSSTPFYDTHFLNDHKLADFRIDVVLGDILKNPKAQALIIAVYQDEYAQNTLFKKIDHSVGAKLTQKARAFSFTGKKGEIFSLSLSTGAMGYDTVYICGVGKRDEALLAVQNTLGSTLQKIAKDRHTSAAFFIEGEWLKDPFHMGKSMAHSLYLSQYHFLKYASIERRKKNTRVTELYFYLDVSKESIRKDFLEGKNFAFVEARGVYMTRDLVNEPASHLHPDTFIDIARGIGEESRGAILVDVLDREECEKLGMGAFLGVAQGSVRKPQFIVLTYKSRFNRDKPKHLRKEAKKICLIGKSIIFDSGGLSLKPSEAMQDMKIDMAGGATVLGVFHTIAGLDKNLQPQHCVYGILPVCENMPSGTAIRPGDIVRTLNGKTVEVLNTDAEGRLTLADALAYAQKYLAPDYMIDLATLTGAIIVALGDDITGLFGRDPAFNKIVAAAAKKEGEELWEMPLYQAYMAQLDSDIADVKNVTSIRSGGAVTAALFLQKFVKDRRAWVHLDIAGSSYNAHGQKGLIPKGGTGWGVRTIMKVLEIL